MLRVEIHKRLGNFALHADLTADHEPLALLGASGSGKSLTLKCIAGILRPDEGRIELDGQILFDSAAGVDLPPQKRGVGYLFQQYALFPNMTVSQNIAVAVREKAARKSAVAESLRRFRLEDVAGLRPAALSGGQRQRTALARMLASRPRCALLDEPLSALDSYLRSQLELELAEIFSAFPGTLLWVTHDRGEAWRACGQVCVMEGGKTQPVVPKETLFHNPGTQSAARLSGCKNCVAALPRDGALSLPAWNLTLRCAVAPPPDTAAAGLRSHHVHPAQPGEENAFPCTVERVVDDVFETIVLLRPDGAEPDAPLLRMDIDKARWAAYHTSKRIYVAVFPENVLALQ